MIDHREVRILQLRELIECGEYRVDPKAVAEALMQRRGVRLANGKCAGVARAGQGDASALAA